MRKGIIALLITLVMWATIFNAPSVAATPINVDSSLTVFHSDQEKTLLVGEDLFTLKHFTNKLNKRSSQTLSVAEIANAPNSKTGGFLLERHLVDVPENFYVLAGEFEFFGFQADNTIKTKVVAGDIVYVPAGLPYGYKNVGAESGKILLITASDGFERFIEEIGTPVTDKTSLPVPSNKLNMNKIAAIAHKYGIEFLN